MADQANSAPRKPKWELASLFALAFALGIGAGLSLSHRYSGYISGSALYVLDHTTGRVSVCVPNSGALGCVGAQWK
jgi:hypothetical protein